MSTEDSVAEGRERHLARGHLLALDGVRGLAILMVIVSHAFESNYESQGNFYRRFGEVLRHGSIGVDLFFILSGFLITGILLDSINDNGYFRKFYARRALRILPLYYGVLGVCLLLTHPLHLQWGRMGWLLPLYLQNLDPVVIEKFGPGGNISLYHFWSLAIEEQFYLVWPAMVFWIRTRSGLLRTMLIGSVGALVLRVGLVTLGVSPIAIHVATACRADSLLLGGLFALLYRSSDWDTVKRWAPWGFVGAIGLYSGMSGFVVKRFVPGYLSGLLWSEGLSYTFLAIGFACLIAWSLKAGSVCSWIFQLSWLRFLGKYSYGLYVLHVLVLSVLGLTLREALLGFTHSKAVAVAGAGLVSLGISVIAAYASYNLYEKHFLKLKHRFAYTRKTLNQGSPDDAFTR